MQEHKKQKLTAFTQALVNQEKARIIVPARRQEAGFWFGGGKLIAGGEGVLYLSGRYRNSGDSRTGLDLGERGAELAVFRSADAGKTFTKIKAFLKNDLDVGGWEVVSIEGSALRMDERGDAELFVSSEKKNRAFPSGLENYHKPGTGSWTIERMTGRGIEGLDPKTLVTILKSDDPRWFNCKDPFLFDTKDGSLGLGFCTHPFNWASSNSAFAILDGKRGEAVARIDFDYFPRGFCWDVGITRATCFLKLPRLGAFKDEEVTLVFYDGGEAMRGIPPARTRGKETAGALLRGAGRRRLLLRGGASKPREAFYRGTAFRLPLRDRMQPLRGRSGNEGRLLRHLAAVPKRLLPSPGPAFPAPRGGRTDPVRLACIHGAP